MKVIIAGGREFSDYKTLASEALNWDGGITEVVCGCAPGADDLGRLWASVQHIPVKKFPADWKKYGKSAGPIRNRQMAEYAEGLLAFWNGSSRGTANMIEEAKRLGLAVKVVRY